jgi:hypothetical protein
VVLPHAQPERNGDGYQGHDQSRAELMQMLDYAETFLVADFDYSDSHDAAYWFV